MNKRIVAVALAAVAPAAMSADMALNPVLVTATRSAQTADQSLAPVSVITRKDINQSSASNVTDLLRLQPGIDFTSNGGPGTTTAMFMRGTESGHTLVLIDGVRAGSATTGSFSWENLPLSQIERIEIVRGPRATLYGSDAIGGVIQIFTRDPDGVDARAGAGTYDTRYGEVGIGGSQGGWAYGLNAAYEESEGFSATNPDNSNYNPDDDGYENQSISGSVRAPLGEQASLQVRGLHSDGESEFDQGTIDSRNQTLDTRLRATLASNWDTSLQLGYATKRLETESTNPSTIDTRRQSAEWQNDLYLTDNDLMTLGVSARRDVGRNVDDGSGDTVFNEAIKNYSAFAHYTGTGGPTNVELGLRHDHHSEFGGHTMGQLAWSRRFLHNWRFVASAGTAFKAPTLNQLFHPGFGGFFAGNPDLDPEKSQSAELSLRWRSEEHSVSANAFYNRIEDLIAYEGPMNQAVNVDEARIPGLELIYQGAWERWTISANATFQRPRNENTDEPLIRRADTKAALAVGKDLFRGIHTRAEVEYVGEREDRNEDLDAFTLLNLAAQWTLGAGFTLEGRVENATDRDYTLVHGYNAPERTVFLGLRYE
jgi:vitamin B12 transporter